MIPSAASIATEVVTTSILATRDAAGHLARLQSYLRRKTSGREPKSAARCEEPARELVRDFSDDALRAALTPTWECESPRRP